MPSDPSRDSRIDALQKALAIYAAHANASPEEVPALLAEHADLRDVLAPMFAAATPDGPDGDDDARRIGGYRLVRELGRGGMGVVHEAVEEGLGRRVALKVLPDARSESPDSLVRFRREAAAAAALDHPGIVRVLAVGHAGDTHFIAMELVQGVPLSRVLAALRERGATEPDAADLDAALAERAGAAPAGAAASLRRSAAGRGYVARIIELVAEVADALQHAHDRGVVHRDVKPANILVRPDGSAVLTDFGIARREDQPSLTRTGENPGTPYYMAPELVQGSRRVDHRCDVFSLGVTLYELLTVRRPFEGRTSQQVMQQIVTHEPVHPQKLNAALASDLGAIVMMALEKDPDRRYATAAALAADLRAFLDYRPVVARPPGVVLRLRRWAQREPLKAGALGLALLLFPAVTAGLGYWIAIQPALLAGEHELRRQEVEAALTRGFLAMEERDIAAARATFEEILAEHPGTPEAIAGLVLLYGPGRADDALAALSRTVPADTPIVALRRLRAHVLEWLGRDGEAERVRGGLGPVSDPLDAFVAGISEIARGHRGDGGAMERALRNLELCVLTAERPRPLYHFERAHALGHLADAERARGAADALDRLWPEMDEARFWAAFALGSTDPARAAEQIRSTMPRAEGRWLFWNNLGYYLQALDELDESLGAYRRSLAIEPDNPGALHDLAIVYERKGMPAEAAATYRELVARRPDDPTGWARIAELALDRDDVGEASAAVAEAERIAPESAGTLQVLGELRLRQGEVDAAVDALRRSLAAGASSRTAFHLGRALARGGDVDGAIAAYRRAVEVQPDNAEAHTNLGNLLRRRGEVADAERHFRSAIAASPALSQPNRSLWELLNLQGRGEELLAHSEEWRARIPGDPHAWGSSAFAVLWLGPGGRSANATAALPIAETALAMAGAGIPTVMHDAAWVLFHAGQRDRALRTMRQALEVAIAKGSPRAGVVDVIRRAIEQMESTEKERP